MQPNEAGVDFPAACRRWPVLRFDGGTTRVDPLSPLPLEDAFVLPDWLFEAVAEAVEVITSTDAGDRDSADLQVSMVAGSDPIPCTRCMLKEPATPWRVVSLLSDYFNASNWYSLLAEDGVPTPKSIFIDIPAGVDLASLSPGGDGDGEEGQGAADESKVAPRQAALLDATLASLEAGITELGGRSFVRLDHASSKTPGVITSAEAAVANLMSTERTAQAMRASGEVRTVMLRTFVEDMADHMEMRCFVHCGAARGVCMHLTWCGDEEEDKDNDEGEGEGEGDRDGGGGAGAAGWGPDGAMVAQPAHSFGAVAPGTLPGCDRGGRRDRCKQVQMRIMREAVRAFLQRVSAATEYQDYVADVAIHAGKFQALMRDWLAKEQCDPGAGAAVDAQQAAVVEAVQSLLWLVEINTPVYLLATAGVFCLDNDAHREILLGALSPVLKYPCVIASVDGSMELAELFT